MVRLEIVKSVKQNHFLKSVIGSIYNQKNIKKIYKNYNGYTKKLILLYQIYKYRRKLKNKKNVVFKSI